MTTRSTRNTLRAGIAGASAVALAVALPLSASAASGISVSPTSGPASGYDVDVTIEDSDTGSSYDIGLCSEDALLFGIPACTTLASDIAGTGSDVTESDLFIESTFTNDHYGIPGQPASWDCVNDGDCVVLVTQDHGTGTPSSTFSVPVTFVP